jgi:hypothetical protein
LLTPGVGARTIASLALVAEVVYGTPARFSDPARFSFAHGGKDGHPFPVPLHVYDETIRVLKGAMQRAKLGNSDRLAAIRRLDTQARALENLATGPDLNPFSMRSGFVRPRTEVVRCSVLKSFAGSDCALRLCRRDPPDAVACIIGDQQPSIKSSGFPYIYGWGCALFPKIAIFCE